MNLGDGMILASAIHQSLHQPVIPSENENFTIPVPQSPLSTGSAEMIDSLRLEPTGGFDYTQQGY